MTLSADSLKLQRHRHSPGVRTALALAGTLLMLVSSAPARADDAGSASALRATYAKHRADMEQAKFGVPLHLESAQTSDSLKGDIHALLDQPFDKVQSALASPDHWCDILILH